MEIFSVIKSHRIFDSTFLRTWTFKDLPKARKFLREKVAEFTNEHIETIELFESGYKPGEPIDINKENIFKAYYAHDNFILKDYSGSTEIVMNIDQTEIK